MSINTRIYLCLLLTCSSVAAMADPYFGGNAYSPYPPGCVTLLHRQADLYGDNIARFWSGSLWLEVANKVEGAEESKNLGEVDVALYRVGCAEPNRSVIMVEFALPAEWVDPRNARLVLPTLVGSTAMDPVVFELKPEPNGWAVSSGQQSLTKQAIGEYTGGWSNPREYTWRYVLDIGRDGQYWDQHFLVEYYNGSFGLQVFSNGGWTDVVGVPATLDLLDPNPDLPLHGRLGGTWVEEGAADQGLLISFSNPVPQSGADAPEPESYDLSVFLSWFTFGPRGEALWVAGNAKFRPGASEVVIPIVQVTQGDFLGSKAGERTNAGSVRLRAKQCNELEADYDLSSLGLGAARMHLQRLNALETAGYPCRDYEARLASLASPPAN